VCFDFPTLYHKRYDFCEKFIDRKNVCFDFPKLYSERYDFREKSIEREMCVLIFPHYFINGKIFAKNSGVKGFKGLIDIDVSLLSSK
jgi:hypothetical protein